MPVYKVVFSNEALDTSGAQENALNFTYRIEAASADDALGLAEIEFAQKHPQMLRTYYRPHVALADDQLSSHYVQHFDRNTPLNPDQ
jgi:hypothetical protein